MDSKLHIFYFSSTHWDREWYQSFQRFRYRLVNMLDGLIEVYNNNDDYKTFHTDGQTIILEDYAEIADEKHVQRLRELIEQKKIMIGPWYVMPDEYLVSGESLIRNLIKGNQVAEKWGASTWKYGYVCDIFGHIAQMPQIFNGFGINYSLLGRGTTENDPVYFRWQSPDGSECLNFNLEPEDGYGAFKLQVYADVDNPKADNPVIAEKIKNYIEREISRSNIPIVIIMDGSDHSDAVAEVPQYIRKIQEMYPNAEVHHVDLCEQGKLLENYKPVLPVIKGELNKTSINLHHYLHLITNTLSSYYPLKKENDECQYILEKETEPMCVTAMLEGRELNSAYVKKAYEYLLKNHPHDSICGCSVDQAHKDMKYRFAQVKEICSVLRDYYIKEDMQLTDEVSADAEQILTLYNFLTYETERTVTVDLKFDLNYPEMFEEPFGYEKINSFKIFDADGNEIPYQLVNIRRGERVRRWNLSATRQKDIHRVTFKAKIPACSKAQYRIVPSEKPVRYLKKLKSGLDYMENEFVKVCIASNGSLTIIDKASGKTYSELGNFVDDCEIGDGWYHVNPVCGSEINSSCINCEIEKVESGVSRCVFKITRRLNVPQEMENTAMCKKQSKHYTELKIETFVGLSEENRYADVKMMVYNTAKDHRLRMFFPTGITTDNYFAGQAFYCCNRKTGIDYQTQSWSEIEQYEKATNGIVGKRAEDGSGIAFVSSGGIHECAAYDDDNGSLSVTLLRSFRRAISIDTYVEAQLNDVLEYSFALAPLDSGVKYADLVKIQELMSADVHAVMKGASESRPIKKYLPQIEVTGENIVTSIVKRPESGENNTLVVRVFNASDEKSRGSIVTSKNIISASRVNLNEEYKDDAQHNQKRVDFDLNPWEIASFKLAVDI